MICSLHICNYKRPNSNFIHSKNEVYLELDLKGIFEPWNVWESKEINVQSDVDIKSIVRFSFERKFSIVQAKRWNWHSQSSFLLVAPSTFASTCFINMFSPVPYFLSKLLLSMLLLCYCRCCCCVIAATLIEC